MAGIENTKKVVNLIIELGNAVDKTIKAEGGFEKYVSAALSLTDEIVALKDLNFGDFKLEFKDLTREERDELLAEVKAKFDLADDVLEARIEQWLTIANDGADLVFRAVKLVEDIKVEVKKKKSKKAAG